MRFSVRLSSSFPRATCLSALLLIATFMLGQWRSSAFLFQRDQAQEADSPQTLTPGVPSEGEIAGGQTHIWQINLSAGDYIQLFFGRQINLDAKLFAPAPNGQEKRLLFSIKDRKVIYSGRKDLNISVIADVPGNYSLEISPIDKNAAPSRYQLKIEALRSATPNDKLRVAAESAAVEGELIIQNDVTPDGRRRGIAKYDEALAIWRELEDRKEELRISLLIGSYYKEYGEAQTYLKYNSQAIQIARDLGDHYQVANLTIGLGGIERVQGNYQKALDAYHQARQLFASLSKKLGEAIAIASIGKIYLSLGEARISLDYLDQALQTFSSFGATDFECDVLNCLGSAHRALGETHEALKLHTRALEIARKNGPLSYEAISLGYLGDTHLELGDKQKAADYHSQELKMCQQMGNRQCMARALNALGNVSFLLGEKEKSLDYLSQSLALSQSMGERNIEADTLYAMARTYYSIGNLTESRKQIEMALDIRESLRASLSRPDLRASFFSSAQSGFDLYIDLLMSLHQQQPGAGYDALALQTSERARARSLLEQLAETNDGIREGIDPQLLERKLMLQQQLNAKAAARTSALSSKDFEASAKVFDKEIAELTSRYHEVEAQIRAFNPRYAALTRPDPLSVAEIQRQLLDEKTLLLEFALGEKRSWLWAVTQHAIISRQIPSRSEIETATRGVYEILTARQPKADVPEAERLSHIAEADAKFQTASQHLSRMLLGQIADSLRGEWKEKRLLIVASGPLEYLPFAALPIPSNDNRYQPLIAEHEIVNLPSASVLSVIRRETTGRPVAPKTVAVLADPVFDTNDPRLVRVTKRKAGDQEIAINTRSAGAVSSSVSGSIDNSILMRSIGSMGRSMDRGSLGRLPFSREEADAIASFVPAKSILKATDFQANRAKAVSGELANYRLLHFATHGLLNSEHPELSGLVLSLVDENGRAQDGFLRMHEIYNLRMPAEVVVLSACQTGLGKQIKGEGLVGLTRGFMYAGAQRVVASLWQVDDLATAELMKRFYRGMLQDDLRPSAALRAAQLEMMKMKQKRWSPPYFWAGFVMQGEWN
jgi:CHAT domain-containing protein